MFVNPIASMRMKFCKFTVLLLLCSNLFFIQACKTVFVNDPEKKAMKQKQAQDKEFEKAYAKVRKQHYKNQSKDTRKRMNKNLKKAKKRNKTKKTKSGWDCN